MNYIMKKISVVMKSLEALEKAIDESYTSKMASLDKVEAKVNSIRKQINNP